LQFNTKGEAMLIPVAILVEGHFYDASAYKAEPVPMALLRGTVYEAEQTGESQGLFTINGALHSKSPGSPHPWAGSGSYLANGSEAVKTTRKAEDRPVGIDNSSDDHPRLTKGNNAKPSTAGAATANSSPTTNSSPASPAAPDSAPKADAADSTKSDSAKSESTKADPTKSGSGPSTAPTTSASTDKARVSPPPATSVQPAKSSSDTSPTDGNYYRPTLRRGKPTEPAPPEVTEVEAKPVKTDASPEAGAATAPPPRLVPAISDEGGPELRSYRFFWKPGEEDDRRTQMQAVAAADVRAYAAALIKNRIVANPPAKTGVTKTTKTTSAHKKATPPVPPVFDNITFRAFDLWGKSQPVMVFTAEARLPDAATDPTLPDSYSVALAATTDIYGNLRPLYTGVTDKFHLDVTPRLALIDAVDADGDGRGELLFSETSDAGSGYLIYRATADKLFKLFDSLGAGE
jgi:hypothetical protein